SQSSLRFHKIAYHEFEGVALDLDERERLVNDLGINDAMILRNHGLIVGSATIPGAFNLIYRLEQACLTQIMAMSCNSPLRMPPKAAVEKTYAREVMRRDYLPGTQMTKIADQGWEALKRRLDRIDSSYKN